MLLGPSKVREGLKIDIQPSYVFDVLWHDGDDSTGKPFMDRCRVLEQIS
jgi:ATP-dependent DNA ligase